MALRKRRGITGTLEQALLIAVTLAFFLGVVVTPMANATKFIWNMPQNAWKNWKDFTNWIDNLVDNVFNLKGTSTP